MEYSSDNKLNQQGNETENKGQSFPGIPPKSSNRNLKISIGVLVVLLVAGFYIYKNKTAVENEQTINYSVVVKESPNDKTKTDVYLKDSKNNQETLYITLSDIYRNHYHNAEYHNGNLYIIHRTGGDLGYQTNPNWTDELWRYNQQEQGQKLYSVRGLDFRVSDDEKMIAIITNEEFNLLNNNGSKIKTFQSNEVISDLQGSPMFGFFAWGLNAIWLDNTLGSSLTGIVKINTSNYDVTKYDLSGLPAGPEFIINVYKEKIAFSNFPAMFDVDSAQEYERSGMKVNLIVYDLSSKSQQIIATSVTKKFEPKWLDESTLEYNNPDGTGRITKQIP
ncbi:TPA: hypothetical protein DD449_00275 [Candidatus Berkelbacteria bacterium]|nr:hypothetical protein [Candidatus Berkelbacteria bacterium]